jgi:hypothetical protein
MLLNILFVLGLRIYSKYLSPKDLKDSYSDLYDINVPRGQERPLVTLSLGEYVRMLLSK